MRNLQPMILVAAVAFATFAFAKDAPVKRTPPQPAPQTAADYGDFSAQTPYGLRPTLDHRPLGGEEFMPGVANGS